jgi:YD repeat-containing protein
VCTAPADMSTWTCGTQLHPDVKFDPTRSSFALGRDQGRVAVTYMPAAGQTNAELPVVKAYVDGAWSSERKIDASTTTVDEVSSGTEARANTIVAAVKDRSVPSNVDLGRLIDLPPLVSSVAVSRSPVSNVSPCDTATFSTAAFNEDVSWTLDIKDHTGSPWRTYTSAGTSTAALNRSWDGKNNSGASLPAATDADFTATVDVADTAVPSAWHVIRPVVAGQLKVRVDTIAPTASAFAVTTTPFSPEAPPNGRRDTTAFTASFSEASTWTITIKNSGGTTVRTLTGGPATSLVAATWDGKNASGSVVADGTYTATLQVTDSACNASGTYGPINVVVDTTGPAISSFSGSPTLFSPNADGQLETTTLSGSIASDPSTPISWQIDIPTVPPKTYTGSGQSVSQVWDGKTGAGVVATDGTYAAQLTSIDNAGATQTSTVSLTVDTTAPVIGAVTATEPFFSPSVSPGVKDTTTVQASITEPSTPVSWKVKIKNGAGNLVRTSSPDGSGLSVSWAWNGRNDAGVLQPEGGYTAVVEATDAAGITGASLPTASIVLDVTAPSITGITPTPAAFSPNADGKKDTTTITGAVTDILSPVASWTLTVLGAGATQSGAGGSASWVWNGSGASQGSYAIQLSATDAAGVSATATGATQVILDTTAPTVAGFAGAYPFSPNADNWRDTVPLAGTVADNLSTFTWTTTNPAGATTTGSTASVGGSWDGRNASGTWVEDGSYTASITLTDAADNTRTPAPTANLVVNRSDDTLGSRAAWALSGPGAIPGGASLRLNAFSYDAVVEEQDLRVDAPGPDVVFARSYNSRTAATAGALGGGWRHTFEESVAELADLSVAYTTADGDVHHYLRNPDGTYAHPPGVFHTLTKNPDGTFVLSLVPGWERKFNVAGRLTELKDPSGNRQVLTYDANGKLTSVTNGAGTTYVTFTYDPLLGTLLSAAGGGRTYTYEVTSGTLTRVTGPIASDVTTMTYDGAGRLLTLTNPRNHMWTVGYGAPGATSITQPSSIGGAWSVTSATAFSRSVTDPESETITYTFAPTAAPLTATEEGTHWGDLTRSYVRNADLQITSDTNPLGNATTSTYDALGRVLTSTNELGKTTTYTYAGQGGVASITDPLGNKRTFTYDAAGRKLTAVSPRGNVTGGTPADYTTTFTYDAVGNRLSETDPLGNKRTFTYDARGRTLIEVSPRGNVAGGTPSDYTTTYAYDATTGDLLSVTDPLGNKRSYTYDAAGRKVTEVSPRGNVTGGTPALHTTSFTYDAVGNLTAQTDPLGNKRTFTYDAMGRKLTETSPRGNETGALPSAYATSYTYDRIGRIKTKTDPLGNTTTYTYFAKFRYLEQETKPRGGTITRTYGKDRTLLQESVLNTASDVSKTVYGYDPAGHLICRVEPRGNPGLVCATNSNDYKYTMTYDDAGRQLSEADPYGNTTKYAYDPDGNRTKVIDPRWATGGEAAYTTMTSYDRAGRRASVAVPGQGTITYGYDGDGNLLTTTNALSAVTTNTYDHADKLASTTHPDAGRTTYDYDPDGNRIQVIEPRGNVSGATPTEYATTSAFDRAGRLISVTKPLGGMTTYGYDADGNRITLVDPRGNVSGATPAEYTWETTYNANGNRLSVTDPTGKHVNWTYNGDQSVATRVDTFGTTFHTYDLADRRTRRESPDPTDPLGGTDIVTYAYDANANLLRWSTLRVQGTLLTTGRIGSHGSTARWPRPTIQAMTRPTTSRMSRCRPGRSTTVGAPTTSCRRVPPVPRRP